VSFAIVLAHVASDAGSPHVPQDANNTGEAMLTMNVTAIINKTVFLITILHPPL
jgi:hypothetical protein